MIRKTKHLGRFLLLSLLLLCIMPKSLFGGSMPAVGSSAPEFTLQSQNGDTVSLKNYRGNWLILFFYPFPGRCALEAENFEHDQAEYQKENAVVLGISTDRAGSQKNCNQERVNFKLLADPDGNVSREYGSVTDLILTKIESRNTFIIDPQGRIAKIFTDITDPTRHSKQVLAALTALQESEHSVGPQK